MARPYHKLHTFNTVPLLGGRAKRWGDNKQKQMKRINNILCYFGLLLILTVVACSDMDELTFPAQEDGEVELTLQTHVPGLDGVASRTAPTENITSITALAFDKQNKLIKVAKATLERDGVEESTSSISGKFTVQVPMRTRHIHFIAKNNDDFTEITEAHLGETDINLLVDRTSTDLHYWQMLDFEGANDLQDLSDELSSTNGTLMLVRNMAKLTLVTNSEEDYIAGFLNYNLKGTLVPYKETGEGESRTVEFGYKPEENTNHDLPKTFLIHSDEQDRELGKTHYIFEEFNDVGDLVYVICKVGGKFYKFAFKKDDTYYYIIRNCQYRINIPDKLTESYGKDSYELAVSEGQVINDTEPQQVHIEIVPNPLYMFLTATGTATVTIPNGITTLSVAYFKEYFDRSGVTMSGYKGQITQTEQDGLWIDTYTVTEGDKEFNITLKDQYKNGNNAIKGIEIGFQGTGDQNKYSNDKLTVHALQQGTLTTITPTTYNLPNTAGSKFTVSVKIPTYNDEVGDFNLRVGDADGKYTVTPPDGLTLKDDRLYLVTEGETYTFTFTLNKEGLANEQHEIIFDIYTDFHDLEGKTTVTLIDNETPDPQSMYAIWVNGNAWDGTTGSVEFFGYEGTDFSTGTSQDLENTFYDQEADLHTSSAMVMGSDDSFTFTIPEGGMWLTMLVASNSGTPNIDLLKDGAAWTTTADANATTVVGTYNFGNGEITTAGRLIRYQLPAGTYKLQDRAAEYLLYYMRVTKDKPVMTDVAQPLLTDYELAWSGAIYNNVNATGHLPIGDDNYLHIVDENHLKHTVSLKDDNSLKKLNLTIADKSSFVLDLIINTTRVHFKEPGSNEYYKTPIEQKPEMDINGSCNLETYNAGVYSLKGTINTPSYKYSAFYDKLILDAVQYEVKSPIMPALYNSMNGNVLTPVDKFTSEDEAWAIGFKMPKIVPDLVIEPENYTINIQILNWTISDVGDARGLGVEEISTNNYCLQKQKQASDNDDNNNPEMYHPREGWTYKIKWASIYESKVIIPTLVGDESSDNMHYFIYDGTIAKSVEIPTPFETIESPLNIALDFYADENGDGDIDNTGNSFNNLLLKLTDQTKASTVYLKATVTGDVSSYYNDTIQLKGDFPSINGAYSGWAMQWAESRQADNSTINYTGPNYNGQGLQFIIDQNNSSQEYLIKWVFKHSANTNNYPGYGDIAFTYTISNVDNKNYNITGDTQATLVFTNEPTNNGQIQVATNGGAASNNITMSLEYGNNSTEEFTVDVPVPTGVTGINISASDFAVSIGKVASNNEQYPGEPISVNGNYTFTDSDKTNTPRFKFRLNGTPSNNQSVITFSDVNGKASSATVTINWTQRGAESNQTTIWNGAMDLQWTRNYLEATANQLQAGTQITLNFTTIGGQNGQIKLHDYSESAIASGNIQGISYDSNNGVNVGNNVTQLTFTLQNAVSGLKINGNNVRMTSIVVTTSAASTEPVIDDDDFNSFSPNGQCTVNVENGILSLSNNVNNLNNPWDVQAMLATDKIVNGAIYTLRFKAKLADNTTGALGVAVQRDNGTVTYYYSVKDINELINNAQKDDQGWAEIVFEETMNVTNDNTTDNPTHFMFNFGHLVGTVYIDDLKLVRK